MALELEVDVRLGFGAQEGRELEGSLPDVGADPGFRFQHLPENLIVLHW